jgi:hypothetical protein
MAGLNCTFGVQACDPAELQAAFRAGWKVAAKWANRDDLMADIGSPAYLKDMAAALSPILADGVAIPVKEQE